MPTPPASARGVDGPGGVGAAQLAHRFAGGDAAAQVEALGAEHGEMRQALHSTHRQPYGQPRSPPAGGWGAASYPSGAQQHRLQQHSHLHTHTQLPSRCEAPFQAPMPGAAHSLPLEASELQDRCAELRLGLPVGGGGVAGQPERSSTGSAFSTVSSTSAPVVSQQGYGSRAGGVSDPLGSGSASRSTSWVSTGSEVVQQQQQQQQQQYQQQQQAHPGWEGRQGHPHASCRCSGVGVEAQPSPAAGRCRTPLREGHRQQQQQQPAHGAHCAQPACDAPGSGGCSAHPAAVLHHHCCCSARPSEEAPAGGGGSGGCAQHHGHTGPASSAGQSLTQALAAPAPSAAAGWGSGGGGGGDASGIAAAGGGGALLALHNLCNPTPPVTPRNLSSRVSSFEPADPNSAGRAGHHIVHTLQQLRLPSQDLKELLHESRFARRDGASKSEQGCPTHSVPSESQGSSAAMFSVPSEETSATVSTTPAAAARMCRDAVAQTLPSAAGPSPAEQELRHSVALLQEELAAERRMREAAESRLDCRNGQVARLLELHSTVQREAAAAIGALTLALMKPQAGAC